ncbi:MAG: DegT/DnrJ/EryC1/StrS aminotransferase family protein [Tenericutes bacterium]|nr:DegT/DnrJ/EryC1/StrS aminotransferase family protein [Mycoplasmatota bacterium]
MKKIPFSPPDISQKEIDYVVDTLKSGWITTGPKTKLLEKKLSLYCNTSKTVCLNSATSALELTLRILGIGPGDEVITSAYTYTASVSVIEHVGAKIVLVDIQNEHHEMDYEKLEDAITDKTKAIIPVDLGGVMCDYNRIFDIVKRKKSLFLAKNEIQKAFGKVIVLADAAHSLGASYNGFKSGEVADFTCFSFHAVKNLTTAEGGAVTWKNINGIDNDYIYREFQLLSLHGQSKDALSKSEIGSWEYDIIYPGYKANMTDIQAALGLAQLERYEEMIERRKQIINIYNESLDGLGVKYLNHSYSSGHLYILRIDNINSNQRDSIIKKLAKKGISTNVHYKPIPMMTAYKNLGFKINDYPNTYKYFENEITLPLYSILPLEDAKYLISEVVNLIRGLYV